MAYDPLHGQRLVIKNDPETIKKITEAYDELRRIHDAGKERQREAGRRCQRQELGLK